jgi:hypothetical protein
MSVSIFTLFPNGLCSFGVQLRVNEYTIPGFYTNDMKKATRAF